MDNVVEYIRNQAAKGKEPEEETVMLGQTLIKTNITDSKLVGTVKRSQKTRKVEVLAFEEWTNGTWVKHISRVNNTEGKREYNSKPRYSRPEEFTTLSEAE